MYAFTKCSADIKFFYNFFFSISVIITHFHFTVQLGEILSDFIFYMQQTGQSIGRTVYEKHKLTEVAATITRIAHRIDATRRENLTNLASQEYAVTFVIGFIDDKVVFIPNKKICM